MQLYRRKVSNISWNRLSLTPLSNLNRWKKNRTSSSVTDIPVRSLALLQQVTQIPPMWRTIFLTNCNTLMFFDIDKLISCFNWFNNIFIRSSLPWYFMMNCFNFWKLALFNSFWNVFIPNLKQWQTLLVEKTNTHLQILLFSNRCLFVHANIKHQWNYLTFEFSSYKIHLLRIKSKFEPNLVPEYKSYMNKLLKHCFNENYPNVSMIGETEDPSCSESIVNKTVT